MKILILDDDPFVIKLLSTQLRAFGLKSRDLELVTCERGDIAVNVLEAGHRDISLIFCDIQMPEMDGVQFIRHLVRLGYRGAVVFVSGEIPRILQAVERLAIAHGLNVLGALHKPVTPEHLQRVMDDVMQETVLADRPVEKVYDRAELRRAIDGGELINHYQPKVDMASGKVVGVEALVRWQHPDDGLVMPAKFVPITEESGFIQDLAKVVLMSALQHSRQWRAAGHMLDVSINLSMANLSSLELPDFIEHEAHEAGVPLSSLIFEITESQLMEDPRAQLDILTRLRLKGCRLSIDDFGIGYSSLAQLRDLPFDELKIDRSFVHGAAQDSSLRAIVESSLLLARQLEMKVVAEGIEEWADWDLLRTARCDMAQGYLLAKPMADERVGAWIESWEDRRVDLTGIDHRPSLEAQD